jgi:NADPH-dependent 2,4-dienoyl-CoA reductase/sulfur reductase-like enzyme
MLIPFFAEWTCNPPFEKILGPEIGALFLALHQEHGVQMRMNERIARIEGAGRVERVVLEGGDTLSADLVVVGIGVRPATDFSCAVPRADDGSILVDARLCAAEDVFAAGDIARFPAPGSGEPIRIEHWRLAQHHGRHAARAMLDQPAPFQQVPFFWTAQYGLSLRYAGHAQQWDEILFWGALEERKFIAWYVAAGHVRAVAGIGHDQELAAAERLLRNGTLPSVDQIRHGPIDLPALLRP